MSDFWEKYKDPRWQRKRLELMELAGFTCEDCGAKDKPLNVHHSVYHKGRNPWEYPNNLLRCVCEDCHQRREDLLHDIRVSLGRCSAEDVLAVFHLAASLDTGLRCIPTEDAVP